MIGREPARARKAAWVIGSILVHAAVVGAVVLPPDAPDVAPPRVVEVQIAPPFRALPPAAAAPRAKAATQRAGRRPAKRARAPDAAPLAARQRLPDAALPRTAPPVPATALASASAPSLEFSGGEVGVVGGDVAGSWASGTGSVSGTGGSPWLADRFREILRRIQRRIDRSPYPPQARAHGWTGLVRVAFLLRTDGTIADLEIRESSGFKPLDRCALEAVRGAVPFPRPPRDEIVVVPIRFELVAGG